MASDPRFLEAWVNRIDHRVLGHRLHPLCLLDLLTLDALNSPFVGENPQFTTADFLIAALVCSRPIQTLEVNPEIPAPSLRDRLRLRFCDIRQENEALKAYFDDYWSSLEMWQTRNDDGAKPPCNAPWILGHVTFLLNHTNLSEWRIWTAPVGQILCYANSLEEQLGGRSIVSEDERLMMEEARRGQS
jgi:hypothetical protein